MHAALKTACPFPRATQVTNLALLVSAPVAKRTLCLSALARAKVPAVDWDYVRHHQTGLAVYE